jgi:hypothetical protein
MVKVASLAAILFSACVALADETKPPVALEAPITPPSQRGFVTFLRVRLVGTGKDVSVVTEGLSATVTQADKKATITLKFTERRDEKGRLIIPSTTWLGIVKLQPDEVAGVQVPNAPDLQKVLTAAAAGELELVVEYEVPEVWGKRFGVVSGKVRGTATVTK